MSNIEQRVPVGKNSMVNERSPSISDSSEDFDDDEEEDDPAVEYLFNKSELTSKLMLSGMDGLSNRDLHKVDPETQARLEALLEAAGVGKLGDGKAFSDPEVLRRLTSSVSCALDEAAAALTRMRAQNNVLQSSAGHATDIGMRSLAEACLEGDVNAVKKLLEEGWSVHDPTDEGESLLSLACSAGYFELVQVLLAMNAAVDDRGNKGDCTPLMEAASGGYIDIVKLLLDNGADVNAKSQAGNTALIYACCGGYEEVVEMLLERGADIESHNENGHTPLMEAASGGHVPVAKLLLDKGACINSHSNEFKESALTLACYKGHLEMVKFLLDAGADQEHKTDEMHTALMEASMDGHVEVARLLLDHGAQVNMPADSFESPLTLAACGGHVELAQLLIERGAHLEEVNDEGYTPLMEASREGHLEMVALLLKHGANIHAQTEETQETALSLACCGGFQEVAAYLLKAGAQIEQGASTPLMEAAQEGHVDLVNFLLGQGCPEGSHTPANVHATTATKDTALSFACENGHTDVADVLLNAGAELEQESEGGRTPLMKAARAGHLCTVQFLISRGADVNRQTTTNDHTVLSLACAGGHQAVVELLLAHGGDPSHKLKDNSTMLIEASKGGHTSVACLLLDTPLPMDLPLTQMGTPTTAASVALPRVPPTHPNYLPGLLDESEDGILLPDSDSEDMNSIIPHISTCSNCAAQTAMVTTASGARLMSTGVQTEGQTLQEKFAEDEIRDQINALNDLTGLDIEGDVLTPPAPFSVTTADSIDEEEDEDEEEEDSDDDSSPVSPPGTASSFPLTPTPSPTSPQFLPAIDIDEETDSNHDTALTFASAGGHDELVLFLLSRGGDIEHRDKKGCTPLILGATAGHTSTVEMLLDHKADIEAQSDRTKDTALSLACSGGRQEVVELLLTRGANFEHRNVSDYTPLSLAASGGYIGIIKVLLATGAEINSRTGSKLGISPLMLAAMNGHTAAVKLLLDMGSDINAQIETNRNTALTLACFQGRHEVVSLLLDRKANIEHRAKTGLTPLMEAASGGYVEVGRILLDRGADVNAPPVPSSRDTALTIAADKGHYKFCELLLSRSALVDVKNKKGASPLWLSANGGHIDVCQLLASYGGDVDSQDHRKVSVLMASFRKGHVKVVKWLAKHVNQFPSDSDCTRYISTITDKDLLKKCHQCMEIIVTAKDRQAAEANKNASILLEELDMEKEREEMKRAAAQRKRDKKKQKKKKKLQEEKEAETNEKNKQEKENIEEKIIEDDENEKPLDQTELEVSQLVSTFITTTVRSTCSPSSSPTPKHVEARRRKSSTSSLDTLTTIAITAAVTATADSGSIDQLSIITTAQITKAIASSIMSSTASTSSSGLSPITVAAAAAQCVAVTLTTSSTPTLPISSVISIPKTSSSTLPSPSRRGRKEDGWKEVVRRGTIKNTGTTPADLKWIDPLSKRSKKITVSSSVISRVIGRGGCNINAIRETTGAHIDIDTSRQKVTGSCIVTIKGHPEATLQAHQLIQALIKDPDCDLNDVLPKKKSPNSPLTYASSLPLALLKPPTSHSPVSTVTTTNVATAASVITPIITPTISSCKTVTTSSQLGSIPTAAISKPVSILGAPPVVNAQRSHQRPSTQPGTGLGLLPTPRAVGHAPTYTHPLVAAQVAAHMRQAGVSQAYSRGVSPMSSAAFNNMNVINARWGISIPNLTGQIPKKQRVVSSANTSSVSTSVTTTKTVTTTSASKAVSSNVPSKQGILKKQTSPVARQLFPPKSVDATGKSPRKSSSIAAKRQPPSYSMAIAGSGSTAADNVNPEASAVSGFSQAHLPGMQNGSMEDIKADLPPVITNLLSQFDQSPNFWNNISHPTNPTAGTVTTSVVTTQTETVVQSACISAPGALFTQTAVSSTSPQKPSPPQSSSSHSSSSSPTPVAPVVNGLPENDRPSLPAIGTERASRRSVTSSPLPTIPGITPMYQADQSSGSPPPGLWSYSYNTDNPLTGGWSSAPVRSVIQNTEKDRQSRSDRETHNVIAGDNLQTFLERLSLSDHLSLFQRNEIDLDALVLMSEKDYADIGLPEGPSSKILNTTRRINSKRYQQQQFQSRVPAPSPVLGGESPYQNRVISQGPPSEQPLFQNRLAHPHLHPHPHPHPHNLSHSGMNPGVLPHGLATSQPWNLQPGGMSAVTSVTMVTTSGDPLLSTRSSVAQETKVNGRGWKAWSSATL